MSTKTYQSPADLIGAFIALCESERLTTLPLKRRGEIERARRDAEQQGLLDIPCPFTAAQIQDAGIATEQKTPGRWPVSNAKKHQGVARYYRSLNLRQKKALAAVLVCVNRERGWRYSSQRTRGMPKEVVAWICARNTFLLNSRCPGWDERAGALIPRLLKLRLGDRMGRDFTISDLTALCGHGRVLTDDQRILWDDLTREEQRVLHSAQKFKLDSQAAVRRLEAGEPADRIVSPHVARAEKAKRDEARRTKLEQNGGRYYASILDRPLAASLNHYLDRVIEHRAADNDHYDCLGRQLAQEAADLQARAESMPVQDLDGKHFTMRDALDLQAGRGRGRSEHLAKALTDSEQRVLFDYRAMRARLLAVLRTLDRRAGDDE